MSTTSMNKKLVRSLIAGSFSAVAALTLVTGTSAQASGGCDPIYTVNPDGTASIAYPDFCDEVVTPHFPINLISTPMLVELMPTLCTPLDLANLEVRAAQTGPDNWQWRYEVNGDTDYLCDTWLDAEVWHEEVGMAIVQTFYVSDIVEANNAGGDYIVNFDLPCAYDTSTHFGPTRILLDEYLGLVQYSPDCADLGDPAIDLPGEIEDIPTAIEDVPVDTIPDTTPDSTPGTTPDTTPADSDDPVFVDTAEVDSEPVTVDTATVPTVPTEIPETPRTPNEPELPRTGSDTTPILIGVGMVVLGLGLGFTSMSMTRKRRSV